MRRYRTPAEINAQIWHEAEEDHARLISKLIDKKLEHDIGTLRFWAEPPPRTPTQVRPPRQLTWIEMYLQNPSILEKPAPDPALSGSLESKRGEYGRDQEPELTWRIWRYPWIFENPWLKALGFAWLLCMNEVPPHVLGILFGGHASWKALESRRFDCCSCVLVAVACWLAVQQSLSRLLYFGVWAAVRLSCGIISVVVMVWLW